MTIDPRAADFDPGELLAAGGCSDGEGLIAEPTGALPALPAWT